jgi:AcrR family transcriptional regulator
MADDTPGRRLTDQGRERKQQLVDQAAVLFAERGYADTRVVDICAGAGVAKGLFYWYFENKEALFAELVRTMRLRLRTAQGEAMDPDTPALVRIRRGTEASVRFRAQHRAYFALLEVEQRSNSLAAVLRKHRDPRRRHRTTGEEAQAEGDIPEDRDPQLLSLGVVGAVAHFSHFHRSGRIEMDVDELARFVGDWVTAALRN